MAENNGYNWEPYQAEGSNTYHYQYEPPKREEPKHNGKPWRVLLLVAAIIVACGLAFGAAMLGTEFAYRNAADRDNPNAVILGDAPKPIRGEATELQNSTYQNLADLIEDVSKSLVTFNNQFSYATGVIIGEDADHLYIATVYHVVYGGNYSMIFGQNDEKLYKPAVQGLNMDTDTAVLKLPKSEIEEETLSSIKIATFGKSSAMQMGDVAVVFSSPMGYYSTPSLGTISGLERDVTFNLNNQSLTISMIQTDAGVNTSGVLFNGNGEIIGMTLDIQLEDSEGIGFAVPSDEVLKVVEELIEKGYVTKPYIGFTGYDAMNFYPQNGQVSWAEYYRLPSGILVATVADHSPAQAAGLQTYDVIISFDGKPIGEFNDMKEMLNSTNVGDVVELEVVRGYLDGEAQTVTLTVTIGQKPQE